jgi:predicted metal-dependent hydrolase
MFEYTLRVSPRAQVVRLCVSPHKGLEVVVPRGFNRKYLPDVLTEKSAWIERALERVRAHREELLAAANFELPSQIQFRAIDMVWHVHAMAMPGKRLSVHFHRPGDLMIHGPIDDESLCRRVLGRFLLVQAEGKLPSLLSEISRKTGLAFSRVRIRRQRARWGSCSAHGAISLNAALMFLPWNLTRYVLIHELCHTVHLNHSRSFWALVEQHDPEYRHAERALRDARDFIPRWASANSPLGLLS